MMTAKSTLLHIYETFGKEGMASIGEAVRDAFITRELEYIKGIWNCLFI